MSRSLISGTLAGIGLLSLYAVTMTILSGWGAAVEQFSALWYLMMPLAASFGIQVGLYTHLKHRYHVLKHGNKDNAIVSAGGVSGGTAMLACCAHHTTEVLPFLGLSGVSLFLTQFQKPILLVSLGINIFGIFVMYKHLKNETISKNAIFIAGIAALTILGVWIIATQNRPNEKPTTIAPNWETKEQSGGNVTILVTPITLRPRFPASFDVTLETHSVNLGFDVAAAAELRDELGNTYGTPTWKGDPPGGHHRKGTLSFPTPLKKVPAISLILKDIAGVKERTFVWKL